MNEKIVVEVDRDLADLIPIFLQTRNKDIAGLTTALATNDFSAMRLIGHGMKGAGGAYGFPPVSDMGDSIESAALVGNSEVIKTELARLQSYLARIEIKLV